MGRFLQFLLSEAQTIQVQNWNSLVESNEELLAAVELMEDLQEKFPDKEIYIVGGTPRDILLNKPINDVDLATNIPPEQLEKYYPLDDISKAATDQQVFNIRFNGINYELARFREDSKNTDRKSNIATATDSFETDTARRDLTINSMGIDKDGVIVDYQGGIEDLKNQIIRTVGDASERFREDATRILRTFRFAANSGFEIDPDTLRSIRELKDSLNDRKQISSESIAQEIYKVAKSGPALARFIEHLDENGILDSILPELVATQPFKHNREHHPEGDVYPHIIATLKASRSKDPVTNIAILFHDLGKAITYKLDGDRHTFHGHEKAGVPLVNKIFKRLKFNNLSAKDKEAIRFATTSHMLIHNLKKLSIKNVVKLVNSEHWNVLKDTAYADEASRLDLFDLDAFEEKINWAESIAAKVGDKEELRKKIKKHIDGQKIIKWFPDIQGSDIGKILKFLEPEIIEAINSGENISQKNLKQKAEKILRL